MNHFGLALSGGGFRATLYHLGVVRFLRDADLLRHVTHITAVSGGSVLGAHLALNWDRYCGSDRDFDDISADLIRYTQLDVRNRIVRRFPLTSTINTIRRMMWLGSQRKMTRPGLLETHYEKFLYGDVPLSELPARPQLHMLSTNLSEGCLCSFNRDGLLFQRRVSGKRDRFEKVGIGLGTVPMAVAASSAFPGFFPPLEVDGWDVGAVQGEYDRQAFTDGGVYDNLGLRMFRCIEQSGIRDATPLGREDFLAPVDVVSALRSAHSLPAGTPMRRLIDLLDKYSVARLGLDDEGYDDKLLESVAKTLWELIRSELLYLDPAFREMELVDASANSLFQYLKSSKHEPEVVERLWINRQIIESTLRQVIGKPCIRAARQEFGSILVSDAGGKFKVSANSSAGGLVKTALRSTDILMDRVYQLELEAFENTFGLISCPIGKIVPRSRDPYALEPELQRQAARIRTDMDRFSDLEVTTLIKHGYCVARNACRKTDVKLASDALHGPPWSPRLNDSATSESDDASPSDGSLDLSIARSLRDSSRRRTWSTLLDWRDWPTYVWIPLIVTLLLSLPYSLYESRKEAKQQAMVLSAIAETSPLYGTIVSLLHQEPATPPSNVPFDEVETLGTPYTEGYQVLSDSRVFDLRGWNIESTGARALLYDRMRVRRNADSEPVFRIQRASTDPEFAFRCDNSELSPHFSRLTRSDGDYVWQLELDFSRVPLETDIDVLFEGAVPNDSVYHSDGNASFGFSVSTTTGLSTIWILMPNDRLFRDFQIVRHPIDSPEAVELVRADSKVELPIGAVVTFRLLNPSSDFRYECRWKWDD